MSEAQGELSNEDLLSKLNQGLEGIVAAATSCSFIDGKQGTLIYRGYTIEDLSEHSSFEEVAYLLWYGKLPTRSELDSLKADLVSSRQVPQDILDIIEKAPKSSDPMDVLRTTVSALGMYDPDVADNSHEANIRKAKRLTSQTPTLVAAHHRLRQGLDVVMPSSDLDLAANFLYMLHGTRPDPYVAKVFDICLILHTEHGLNASTFSSRVTASTLADMHAAVTSAIGTLKGPLHGGANEQVMKSLEEIGTPDRAEEYVRDTLASHKRIMGFGHRVYKTMDPRAKILKRYAKEMSERSNDMKWFEICEAVEQAVRKEKPNLYPNVDFYSGTIYHLMGIPTDLFTPVFAISRMVGWTAQLLEQYANNRLIRPESVYVGPLGLTYVPIDQR